MAALLLADGRFPGGGYAHSHGLEAAVGEGAIDMSRILADLRCFAAGRLTTAGATDGWLAAAACTGVDEVALDAEADARCCSPALRRASRRLGHGLRRAAGRSFPSVVKGPGEHHSVVIGAVARAAGVMPEDAARLAVHHLLLGIVSASVRLLPIDAADAMTVVTDLLPRAEGVVAASVSAANTSLARGCLADGPAWSAPVSELRAERHARWEVRLFAS